MHRVELMCRQWVCWFQLPPRFFNEITEPINNESSAKLGFVWKTLPFRHRVQSPKSDRSVSAQSSMREFCYLRQRLVLRLAEAHCPLTELLLALGVFVENRDSTWHTKVTGFLRCNVRSKSRWFIKFCNSYYIFAFCRVLHRCENQEVHRWKVYFVWCVLHSSRWYPNPEVGLKRKKKKRAEAATLLRK